MKKERLPRKDRRSPLVYIYKDGAAEYPHTRGRAEDTSARPFFIRVAFFVQYSMRTVSRISALPTALPPPSTTAICGSSATFTSICSCLER